MPPAKIRIPHTPAPNARLLTDYSTDAGRAMLFGVTKVGKPELLWPFLLALHVNPSSLQEQFNKNKNIVMTRGGFVEFVWPDDLDSLSADSTTGAFIGPDSGLTADSSNPSYKIGRGGAVRQFRGRHGTIAWERMTDLLELFRSNGQIFNGSGAPVLRSQILCMYDRGVYTGWFSTFEVSETADMPFQFKLTWEFKITETIYKLPISVGADDEIQAANGDPVSTEIAASDQAAYEETIRNKAKNDQPVEPEPIIVEVTTSDTQRIRSESAKYGY